MKNLMWLEKGINNHNTMKWVWYLVGVVKLWVWFVVVPKIGFEKFPMQNNIMVPDAAFQLLKENSLVGQLWSHALNKP